MADARRITVAHDIRCPFEFGRVCVSSTDVLVLKRLELLGGAEFVGLMTVSGWNLCDQLRTTHHDAKTYVRRLMKTVVKELRS